MKKLMMLVVLVGSTLSLAGCCHQGACEYRMPGCEKGCPEPAVAGHGGCGNSDIGYTRDCKCCMLGYGNANGN
jgi:hypothetical protein